MTAVAGAAAPTESLSALADSPALAGHAAACDLLGACRPDTDRRAVPGVQAIDLREELTRQLPVRAALGAPSPSSAAPAQAQPFGVRGPDQFRIR